MSTSKSEYIDLQRLSQGHLKTLQECPRKFEYIYLSSLATLLPTDQQQNCSLAAIFTGCCIKTRNADRAFKINHCPAIPLTVPQSALLPQRSWPNLYLSAPNQARSTAFEAAHRWLYL